MENCRMEDVEREQLAAAARDSMPPDTTHVVEIRMSADARYASRSRRSSSVTVRSAVGTTSSRSSGIGLPLSTESP